MPTLDLGRVVGDTGPQGPTGPIGPTGPTGPAGSGLEMDPPVASLAYASGGKSVAMGLRPFMPSDLPTPSGAGGRGAVSFMSDTLWAYLLAGTRSKGTVSESANVFSSSQYINTDASDYCAEYVGGKTSIYGRFVLKAKASGSTSQQLTQNVGTVNASYRPYTQQTRACYMVINGTPVVSNFICTTTGVCTFRTTLPMTVSTSDEVYYIIPSTAKGWEVYNAGYVYGAENTAATVGQALDVYEMANTTMQDYIDDNVPDMIDGSSLATLVHRLCPQYWSNTNDNNGIKIYTYTKVFGNRQSNSYDVQYTELNSAGIPISSSNYSFWGFAVTNGDGNAADAVAIRSPTMYSTYLRHWTDPSGSGPVRFNYLFYRCSNA